MDNKIIWTTMKKAGSGEFTYYKGAFAKVIKEITKGNTLKGIKLDFEKVGFLFGDEPETDLQEIVEKPAEDSVPTAGSTSRDGEVVNVEGRSHIIREIPITEQTDSLAGIIAKKQGISKSSLLDLSFHRGFADLAIKFAQESLGELGAKNLVKKAMGSDEWKPNGEALFPDSLKEMFKEIREEQGVDNNEMPKEVQEIFDMLKKSGADVNVKKVSFAELKEELTNKKPKGRLRKFLGL